MTSTNDPPEPDDLHRTEDRIDLLHVEDGVVMYDRGNSDAWLASDQSVSLAKRR